MDIIWINIGLTDKATVVNSLRVAVWVGPSEFAELVWYGSGFRANISAHLEVTLTLVVGVYNADSSVSQEVGYRLSAGVTAAPLVLPGRGDTSDTGGSSNSSGNAPPSEYAPDDKDDNRSVPVEGSHQEDDPHNKCILNFYARGLPVARLPPCLIPRIVLILATLLLQQCV